jgi:hypothetical protein
LLQAPLDEIAARYVLRHLYGHYAPRLPKDSVTSATF